MHMHRKCSTAVAAAVILALLAPATRVIAQVATDNADNAVYNDGAYLGDHGGSGWGGPWFETFDGGGGTFTTTNRQVDGTRSFSIFPGDDGYVVGRWGTTWPTALYTVKSRHDLNAQTGFSGFNIQQTGGGHRPPEQSIITFGLPGTATPGAAFNTVLVQGLDGPKLLTLTGGDGEIRGDVLSWAVWIDAGFGVQTYTLNVTSDDGGFATATGTTNLTTGLLYFGFANLNVGAFQDFHFDNPTLAPVPEPETAAALALAAFAALARRRIAS